MSLYPERSEFIPKWLEYVCAEDDHHLIIGKEDCLVSEDRFLMPTQKDQRPPDLRNFDH